MFEAEGGSYECGCAGYFSDGGEVVFGVGELHEQKLFDFLLLGGIELIDIVSYFLVKEVCSQELVLFCFCINDHLLNWLEITSEMFQMSSWSTMERR